MEPKELSLYLRERSDFAPRRRRWPLGLTVVGAAIFGIVSPYETGVGLHLPVPSPKNHFDSEHVDVSGYAYSRLSTLASVAPAALVLPEVVRAVRHLLGGG